MFQLKCQDYGFLRNASLGQATPIRRRRIFSDMDISTLSACRGLQEGYRVEYPVPFSTHTALRLLEVWILTNAIRTSQSHWIHLDQQPIVESVSREASFSSVNSFASTSTQDIITKYFCMHVLSQQAGQATGVGK